MLCYFMLLFFFVHWQASISLKKEPLDDAIRLVIFLILGVYGLYALMFQFFLGSLGRDPQPWLEGLIVSLIILGPFFWFFYISMKVLRLAFNPD